MPIVPRPVGLVPGAAGCNEQPTTALPRWQADRLAVLIATLDGVPLSEGDRQCLPRSVHGHLASRQGYRGRCVALYLPPKVHRPGATVRGSGEGFDSWTLMRMHAWSAGGCA